MSVLEGFHCIRDHGGMGLLTKNITQKILTSQYHSGTLAVLVRYNQAQKCSV